MGKSILLIHGRDFKPPEADLKRLWIDALRFGIERDHPAALPEFDAAAKEFVYYGDISNTFLSAALNEPIVNDTPSRQKTLDQLKAFKRTDFRRTTYDKLPGKSAVKEALADTLAGALAFLHLSNPIIEAVAPDMREYWNEDSEFGTDVRFPMIAPLKRAMDRGDDILVLSHSLGTMIAYDTFWKFCRTGEYRPEYSDKKIHVWITLGSPLADETVKRNLKGAGLDGERRFPSNVIEWINVTAEDDFISHDQVVADDYAEMKKLKLVKSITDKRIYNLSLRDGKSNPHHEGGYLIHPFIADTVAEWL